MSAPLDARLIRAATLRGFVRLAQELLTTRPRLASVHLGCTQYYCDEASDAVHCTVAVSEDWQLPVADESGEDVHPSYDQIWRHLQWDENGTAVHAFAPLCNEEGWTDREEMDDLGEGGTISPLAAVHRLADGRLCASWLGALHRPWLDFHGALDDRDSYETEPLTFATDPPAPPLEGREVGLYADALAEPGDLDIRDVLADVWLQRDDPRGYFTAACRARDRVRAAELVLAHGRAWLGPLAAVIPLGGALFAHGPFVDKAIVYGTVEALARHGGAAEWATVRALTFAPESARLITPAMRGLRSVGPISAAELPMLAGHAIEELDYEASGDLALLANLPLRTLIVRALGAVTVPAIPGLERVELWLPGSADATAVRDAFRDTVVPAGCALAVGILHGKQRTGLVYTGDRIAVRQPDARAGHAAAWSAALGVPPPLTWDPDDEDWLAFALGVA